MDKFFDGVSPLLVSRGDKKPDVHKLLAHLEWAEAAGDFLPDFILPQVTLGLIVVKWGMLVGHEAQRFIFFVAQPQ